MPLIYFGADDDSDIDLMCAILLRSLHDVSTSRKLQKAVLTKATPMKRIVIFLIAILYPMYAVSEPSLWKGIVSVEQ